MTSQVKVDTLSGATGAGTSVTITGGTITGITDLAVADGGTGAGTAANARINLELGSTVATGASSLSVGELFVKQGASLASTFLDSTDEIVVSGASGAGIFLSKTGTTGSAVPSVTLFYARGDVTTPVIVQSGDTLGSLYFKGAADSTSGALAAEIRAIVDTTPGASADMPGALQFLTSPDGTATPVSRIKIGQQGNVILNNSGSALATSATGGFTYIPSCAGTPTGVPAVIPTGAAPIVLDSTNNALYYYKSAWRSVNSVSLGTTQATTSGTAFDFTVPADTRRITIIFEGISLSGTDNYLVQLGDIDGIETSGYVSSSGSTVNAAASVVIDSTSGFIIHSASAGNTMSGTFTLNLLQGFQWIASHTVKQTTTTMVTGAGQKATSAALTTVRLTRTGTDTFDAGTINISYE